MGRNSTVERKTAETDIRIKLEIDGSGISVMDLPVPFLKHMLESFAKHGCFDIEIAASGDIENDPHHLVEDLGICLGKVFSECLGDRAGIRRFGFAVVPMDESEASVSIDIGGRPYLRYNVDILNEKIGNMSTMLVEDFFRAFSTSAMMNIHISKNSGINSHHIIEAVFKAFALALKAAAGSSGNRSIPSTKGLI
jgi:imidazoleglycerol-phosphate dehydratase